jgi:hypothetical protein
MGNFHKCFFLSVNVINFAKLLEKNCKNFQHQKIKEILLFKIDLKNLNYYLKKYIIIF